MSSASAYTLHLQALTWEDAGRAGGKAATLGELARRGFDVPDGFVLTPAALAATLANVGPVPLADPLALGAASLPADVRAALRDALAPFGDAPLAVRSSAVDEDGRDASFAGQHESYLNVSGLAQVLEAVLGCWRSGWSERALDYRRRHGLSASAAGLAVLVQRLVPADVSAVAFSADPMTGHGDTLVVNAAWGLGESLVGGTMTPDAYRVRKADLAVTNRHVAEKRRMTIMAPGGTREVDVPLFLRARAALDDAQLDAVAGTARTLEQAMGWPVDVEFAFVGDRLHLLQCRPITASSP